jgi:hypothetical protein
MDKDRIEEFVKKHLDKAPLPVAMLSLNLLMQACYLRKTFLNNNLPQAFIDPGLFELREKLAEALEEFANGLRAMNSMVGHTKNEEE